MDRSKPNITPPKAEENKLEVIEDILGKPSKKPSFSYDTSSLPIAISDRHLDYLDNHTIAPKYYNNFNFAKLSKKFSDLNIVLGITSANKGEGKTLVASNMAFSLAKAYQQRTVLVDMNFKNPKLHEVFGAKISPGLAEAMESKMLRVHPTRVENLFLLSAGECNAYQPGIKDTLALREILYTLKCEFDFIIVDMGAVFPFEEFPVHFVNEMDGLITVVDTQNTRQEDLSKIYKHIDEERFVGYIFNKVNDS
jgi:Mrp family chromosome partitioning ATPase